jgi:hypothetical protein
MPSLVTLVFILTYVGMALGRVPGLKLDRVGIALIALVLLLASESVAVGDLGAAIDGPTLILLFALMILSAQFGAADSMSGAPRASPMPGGARTHCWRSPLWSPVFYPQCWPTTSSYSR